MKKEKAKPQEYSANFKLRVILDVLNNDLSIHESVRKYSYERLKIKCFLKKSGKKV